MLPDSKLERRAASAVGARSEAKPSEDQRSGPVCARRRESRLIE
jgi:hypothetical protein